MVNIFCSCIDCTIGAKTGVLVVNLYPKQYTACDHCDVWITDTAAAVVPQRTLTCDVTSTLQSALF